MTSNDFLDVLGKVDDSFVEEAAAAGAYLLTERLVMKQRRPKRMWLVAAAFALVVLSCASWLMLRRGPDPGRTTPGDDPQLAVPSSAPVATASNATEFVWPEDEFPYPRAAILQWLEDMGISLESYYDMLKHPVYMAMSSDGTREIDADPELEAALMNLRIGGLYLGQPQEEVYALYGEPITYGVSDEVQSDGTRRDRWVYHFGPEQSLRIGFVDAGDGFVVNDISCPVNLEAGMPCGIQIGQPFDEAEAAFRKNPILDEAAVRRDYSDPVSGSQYGSVSVMLTDVNTGEAGCLEFAVNYRDHNEDGEHIVKSIHLGFLYPDPPQEEIDPEQEEINRRFDSNEITVWLPDGAGWQGQTWTEEEAKVIWAQLSVALPEPWEYDGSDPIAVLDFHNGYAAAFFDEQAHGAVYRVTDRAAFEAGLSSGDPLRGLELWEYGQFAPNTTQFVRDPEQVSADWDLNYNVDAPMKKLLAALETKNTILFRASDDRTVLFREKKHYVMAYAYGENEKITGYARFFEDHSMDIVAGYKVPLIELDEPTGLLGMKPDAVKAAWGEPCFETVVNGTSCPGYLTFSGYVVVLHPNTESAVVEIELYDHDPTPVTIR